MNSKAIKRQLLAAIAMVLVAALALGSSTYAWFVASGSVTATGMSVNVQSTGGLLIKYSGEGDGWGQTASAKPVTEKLLKPTSTKDMTVWSTATAAAPGNYAMADETIKPVTVADDANITNNDYVLKHTFYIRSTGNTDGGTKGLYISNVNVTAQQELNMSMRIGIVASYSGNEKARFIMAPITVGSATVTDNYTVYTAKPVEGETGKYTPEAVSGAVSLTQVGTSAAILDASTAVPGNSDSDYVKVSVFIWYEGQDEHLYSDNVHANEGLNITLEFSSNTTSSTGSQTTPPAETTVDLTSATVESVASKQSDATGTTKYYAIQGKTLNGKQLYVTSSDALSSTSTIYTIKTVDGAGYITAVDDVTAQCTLPGSGV